MPRIWNSIMYFGILSASTEFDSSCPPPSFFPSKITQFSMWRSSLGRHYWTAAAAPTPSHAAVLCRRRCVLLNRIMQNSQFWGKNDALPSFALYFTVTTFWNVLELNKKKGIRTAADTDQSGFSFCNEFALEFLAVIGYKFFLAYQISIC